MRFVLLLVVMTFATIAQSEVYTVAVPSQYADIFLSETNDPKNGFRCPLSEADVKYEVIRLPLARVLYELDRGTVDIGFPFVANEGRDRIAARTMPVMQSRYFFVMEGDTSLDLDDPDQRIAFVRGFAGHALFKNRVADGLEINELDQGLSLLAVGRVDALMTTEQIYQHHTSPRTNRLKVRPAGEIRVGYYVGNEHHDLVAALNKGIDECQDLALTSR